MQMSKQKVIITMMESNYFFIKKYVLRHTGKVEPGIKESGPGTHTWVVEPGTDT